MLPNLLIIGAGKSGTTSLHHYLAQHPEASMSRQKELQFFTRDDWREKLDWYEARFPERAAIRGESSPVYTMHPFFPSPAERIRSVIPSARLIYVVRDPIERLLAHYVEALALGYESRSLEASLTEDGRKSLYVCSSLYSTQIDQYTACFPEEQLLVLDHHDLLANRQETMRLVFSFLGIASDFTSPVFERTLNMRREKIRPNELGLAVLRKSWAQRWLARGPTLVQAPIRRVLGKPVRTPPIAPATRARLAETFKGDVERLRAYTGKRFATWSV